MGRKKSTAPLKPPEYRGGKQAMQKFIKDNLQYPEEALENKIEGIVEVEYVINGLGNVIEHRILRSLGFGCDEEAIRLVRSLVFEKVYNHGLNTRTKRNIRIQFRLPKTGVSLKYQLTKNNLNQLLRKRLQLLIKSISIPLVIKIDKKFFERAVQSGSVFHRVLFQLN